MSGKMKRGSGKSRCQTNPTSASVGGPPTVVHVPMPDHLESTIVANLDGSGQIASVREGSLGGVAATGGRGGGGHATGTAFVSSTAVAESEMSKV